MMSAFMFPIYLERNKIKKHTTEREREDTEGTTESREAWYQERPVVGPNRPERERQS